MVGKKCDAAIALQGISTHIWQVVFCCVLHGGRPAHAPSNAIIVCFLELPLISWLERCTSYPFLSLPRALLAQSALAGMQQLAAKVWSCVMVFDGPPS
jgi:hypothetical protein